VRIRARALSAPALIGLIVLVGGALRLWTIGDGLPYNVGQDEPDVVSRAVGMMKTGDYNPHFVDYGGLTFYLHLVVACVRFLYGAMRGEWANLDQAWDGEFFLWSRVATALIGTLTIYIVYRAGVRWNARVALVAALAMALHSGLVRESHFALTDTPLTFFVACALLLSLAAGEQHRMRWFLLAGACAGFAAAVKYPGIVALLMPIGAAITVPSVRAKSAAVAGTLLGAAVAFSAGAPYSLIDLPGFLNGFAALMQHYNKTTSAADQAITALKYLAGGFTLTSARIDPYRLSAWPAAALLLVGLAVIARDLRRRDRRAVALVVLPFPLAYFWFVAHQSLLFARYLMPVLPVVCLGLALGIDVVRDAAMARWRDVRWSRRLIWIVPAVVLAGTAFDSVSWNWSRRAPDTAEAAARWILDHVDRRDPIVIESMWVRLPPEFQSRNELRLSSRRPEAFHEEGAVYLVSTQMDDAVRRGRGGEAAFYNALLSQYFVVEAFSPGPGQLAGPHITILKAK
jgi:hypothetical protein